MATTYDEEVMSGSTVMTTAMLSVAVTFDGPPLHGNHPRPQSELQQLLGALHSRVFDLLTLPGH